MEKYLTYDDVQIKPKFSDINHRKDCNTITRVTKNVWLDIWGVWDTGWYLNIAQNWNTIDINSHGGANYGYFP